MSISLHGKIAAITGGASGIGLACARQLVEHGVTTYLLDRDEQGLRAATAELGPRAHGIETDLLRTETIDHAISRITSEHGRLDILHANAGAYVGGPVWEGDPNAWDRMLDLNVRAAFRTVRAALPSMMEHRAGDIVLTSSIAGLVPIAAEPIYTASKHAVQAFTHTTRRQLAPHGIRVGAIQPGPVVTPLLNDWDPARLRAEIEAGAMMQATDVADAVIFMLTRRPGTVVRDLVLLPHHFDV